MNKAFFPILGIRRLENVNQKTVTWEIKMPSKEAVNTLAKYNPLKFNNHPVYIETFDGDSTTAIVIRNVPLDAIPEDLRMCLFAVCPKGIKIQLPKPMHIILDSHSMRTASWEANLKGITDLSNNIVYYSQNCRIFLRDSCFRCGVLGHIAPICPKKLSTDGKKAFEEE